MIVISTPELLYTVRKKELELMFNELGQANPERWTIDALTCYNRGCVCKGCPIKNLITSSKCKMKASVMELVKKIGAPKRNGSQII